VARFVPLLDRVLVQKFKQEAVTSSGIYLPDAAKQQINQAKVIATGLGRNTKDGKKIEVSVKPGDTVVIPEYGGMQLKFDNEEYHVFRDDDIVGIVKDA